jgi:hypothetical protein
MLFYALGSVLVVAASVALASISRRWIAWIQGAVVGVLTLGLLVVFAVLAGVPVFAQPWLILGGGIVAFLGGWGWSQLTRWR